MKIYLAVKVYQTLLNGDYTTILGIFSTEQKAIDYLLNNSFFSYYEDVGDLRWKHEYAGVSTWLKITEHVLDEPFSPWDKK